MTAKSNMYEGVITYNPLGGECPHKCVYCSTNNLKRFPGVAAKYSGHLQLYPGYPKESNKTVFVVGQNDLFAKQVPFEWIGEIISRCRSIDNEYLFQSKNPMRMKEFAPFFPERTILCTTIETNRIYQQMGNTTDSYQRALAMNEHKLAGFKTQVTIEPIMDFDLNDLVDLIKLAIPDQVNIGADSKRNNLPEPSKEKVLALIAELEKFTVVKQKSNLTRLLK